MDDSLHMHGATRRNGPRYTIHNAQWGFIKEIVRQLYFEEDKTLPHVVDILSEHYGFTLTEKQLKGRLSDWGFEKNIKGDIMIQIAWTELMRKREGKRSVFRFNERVVREKKIARYLKRYKISDEDLLSMACPVKGPTSPFRVFTPRASPSDVHLQAAHSMQDPIQDPISHPDTMSPDSSHENWQQVAAPCARDLSSAVITSQDKRLALRGNPFNGLPRHIPNRPDSPEILLGRFKEQICPFLSVADGQNNLWQTLVLPLVQNSQTLCHSISAVTALHIYKNGELHCYGRELLSQSYTALNHEVESETPSITTLASILILAFWTRWDEGLQIGKEHIIGAMSFLQKALSQHGTLGLSPDFSCSLFAFLYDTCSRMDSLSRLVRSALTTDQSRTMTLQPFDEVYPAYSLGLEEEPQIDPWMGYIRSLYQLIGRTADLCDQVRSDNSNSPSIITQAESLKGEIETWNPDPTILLRLNSYNMDLEPGNDITNMAEAYRYATLLYLHQVVPEIFEKSTQQLAQSIFACLSAIPSNSRIAIIQHYPLFMAGCEARNIDDREWVKERWMAMMAHMNLKNIDNCLEITQEVWRRRDSYRRRQKAGIQPRFGSFGDIDEKNDPEFTVQGIFHWASAMKDLNFQVAF